MRLLYDLNPAIKKASLNLKALELCLWCLRVIEDSKLRQDSTGANHYSTSRLLIKKGI